MVMVICKKCLIEKNQDDFRKKIIGNKAHYENVCKKCQYERTAKDKKTPEGRAKRKEYYAQNKDKINAARKEKRDLKPKKLKPPKQSKEEKLRKNKEWQKNNPEKKKTYWQKYHETHKEEEAQYRKDNRETINKRVSEYSKNNKDIINKQTRKRRKNPLIKLRHNISTLVRFYITEAKNGSIMTFLNYTIEELKNHLQSLFEPWMTWENYGIYNKKTWNDNDQTTWTWQLDHIIPQSDLPYASMSDENFKICWALENLRPYSSKQNLVDGTSRKRHKK